MDRPDDARDVSTVVMHFTRREIGVGQIGMGGRETDVDYERAGCPARSRLDRFTNARIEIPEFEARGSARAPNCLRWVCSPRSS